MRFMKNTSTTALLLGVFWTLPAFCDGPVEGEASHKEVTSTQEPLLSTQELESLASRCPQEIEGLHEKRREVPRERARDFSVALGIASDDCVKLKKVIDWLRVGSKLQAHYQQHLERAKSTVGAASQDLGALSPEPVPGGHSYSDDAIEAAPLALE